MPLPSSGTLALVADIGDEQHRPTATGNVVSVADCGIAAGFSAPFAFSDFYDYTHITRTPFNLGTPDQTLIGIQEAPSAILNGETKCTIQMVGRFTDSTTGVLYESGKSSGGAGGLAIYITTGGVLYCVAGEGNDVGGSIELSNTLVPSADIREISVGIELLPFIRGALYINSSVVDSSVIGGQYASGVSNNDASGTGAVYGNGIRDTYGPTTSGISSGTIIACNIWTSPIKALFPAPTAPSTDMIDRMSYTSSNNFNLNASNNNGHDIWGDPDNKKIYVVQRASPSSMWKYTLSTDLDPTTASSGTSSTYTGIARSGGFAVNYTDGSQVYFSEDATDPLVGRYDLGTSWDPTSTLTKRSLFTLTGNFVGTGRAPQGIEYYEVYSSSSVTGYVVCLDQTGYLQVRLASTLSTLIDTFTINSTNVTGFPASVSNLSGLRFFYGGYKLLVTSSSDQIYEFDFSTPYDFSTISYVGNLSIPSLVSNWGGSDRARGIWGNPYHPETTGLWIVTDAGTERVYKIDLSYI